MKRKSKQEPVFEYLPVVVNFYRFTIVRFLIIISLLLLQAVCLYAGDEKIIIKTGFEKELSALPVTGRLFLYVSKDGDVEPRLKRGGTILLGLDVEKLKPGDKAAIDGSVPAYPIENLKSLPAGYYYIQFLLNVYTEFHRADGLTIWAHMDQWEGQKFNVSPGNFYSEVKKVFIDPAKGINEELFLTKIIPPVKMPEETQYVKRIKIKSKLLTEFWGHPFYLGATILLPKGYEEHPDVYYPVEYEQTHFSLSVPHGFNPVQLPETPEQKARRLRNSDETGYEFYQQWMCDTFPRMICVSFQHPTPYYDDSYAVNSANCGPFGDAIMKELIPYIEEHFRIIKEPYARILTGGSTGGWEALALQVYHPGFFGGAWVYFPDPIDFRSYGVINIYEDDNAYYVKDGDWRFLERPMDRSVTGQPTNTFKNQCRYEAVLGSKNRSCEQIAIWDAVYGPTDKDGYPKPLWNRETGKIDTSVVAYMRDNNYDLRYYLEKNWNELGPLLKDKLHFSCGDMDNLFLNLGVYRMEEFLEKTKNPYYNGSFIYGRPLKGHGWKPKNNYETLKEISSSILKFAREHNYQVKWMYEK